MAKTTKRELKKRIRALEKIIQRDKLVLTDPSDDNITFVFNVSQGKLHVTRFEKTTSTDSHEFEVYSPTQN